MISMIFFFLLIHNRINGKFILNSESSSIIVLRHIRLSTDNEYYRIRCPYNLNHLTLTLLNYSNENCFNLYTKSLNDYCKNYRSPCLFHAKSIQMNCNNQVYSNYVDITYQCSLSSSILTSTISSNNEEISISSTMKHKSILFSSPSSNPKTLHALSFRLNSNGIEESIGIFIIGLAAVFILWITVCCLWFIRCGHIDEEDNRKCELLSIRSYQKADIIDLKILSDTKPMIVGNLFGHTNTGGLENISLHVNPLENKRISSLKITQID